jgi:hypothetical protein
VWTDTVSDAVTLRVHSPSVAVTVICADAPGTLGAVTLMLTGAVPEAPLAPTLTDLVKTVNVHPAGAGKVLMVKMSLFGTPAHVSVNGSVVVLAGATFTTRAPIICADPVQVTA